MAERILIVRADGVGDALMLTPLVAALHAAGHELGAVLSTRNRDVFAERAFARVHALERIPWPKHGSTKASLASAVDEARAARYSVALVASEEPEAYRFAVEAGILRRVGFTNGWEKPFKSLWTRGRLTKAVHRTASAGRAALHEVETLFALGDGLHDERGPTRDVARLARLVLDEEARPHGRIVLQTSSKYSSHGVVSGVFAAIARRLAEHGELLVVADAADEELARLVAQKTGVPFDIPASLGEWKALIGGASATVTLDSGAAHVAGMLGVPCVDVFAVDKHVAADVRRWHPWAAPYRAIVVTRPPQRSLPVDVADALDELRGEAEAP